MAFDTGSALHIDSPMGPENLLLINLVAFRTKLVGRTIKLRLVGGVVGPMAIRTLTLGEGLVELG
jgi:hypothetical protein